jgi:hypothetical protein
MRRLSASSKFVGGVVGNQAHGTVFRSSFAIVVRVFVGEQVTIFNIEIIKLGNLVRRFETTTTFSSTSSKTGIIISMNVQWMP